MTPKQNARMAADTQLLRQYGAKVTGWGRGVQFVVCPPHRDPHSGADWVSMAPDAWAWTRDRLAESQATIERLRRALHAIYTETSRDRSICHRSGGEAIAYNIARAAFFDVASADAPPPVVPRKTKKKGAVR